ncbi:PqqD family protein [Nocardioides mangrovicus]|uniref:PqqD family protein n=1 Tax=Nocardioides mangrovicus TaxID=2478913 RepID=A0A3L8NXT2_9ACTN|nr:PqqD family protein [Nocardioides mangrovicus]RLV47492.1 PqqD family protein [Nocardioides mangrovicus]
MSQIKARSEDLSWREVDEEIVILDLASSQYFSLNGTGAVLWKVLADGADEDGLVAALTSAYDVDEAQARADVAAFVAHCQELGVLA